MFKSKSRTGVSWVVMGIAAVLCALPALAEDATRPGDPKDRPMRPGFSDIDTNHDGVISQAEFEAFKPKRPEGGPRGDHEGPPPGGPGAPGPGGRFDGPFHGPFGGPDLKRLDTDGDGKVSLAEFLAPVKMHFAEIDANKDGFLDEAELKAPPPEGPDGKMPRPPEK